jgi:hypothetical protein
MIRSKEEMNFFVSAERVVMWRSHNIKNREEGFGLLLHTEVLPGGIRLMMTKPRDKANCSNISGDP